MMIVCVSPDIMQSQQGFAKVGSFRGIYAGVSSAAIGSFPNDESLIMSLCEIASVMVPCLIRVPTEEVKQRTQALLEEVSLHHDPSTPAHFFFHSLHWSWRQGHTPFFWQATVCGAFAGLCAGVEVFVTNPLDVSVCLSAGTSVANRNIPLVMLDVWKSRGLTVCFLAVYLDVYQTSINLGGFIFLGAYEKVRLTLI
uniref:Uncharacterized protein n=1 Tax=Oncorhynchus kisutch TaxID=8019 RepID=A0A8C7GY56_ONCKI